MISVFDEVLLVWQVDYDAMATLREDPISKKLVGFAGDQQEAETAVELLSKSAVKYQGYDYDERFQRIDVTYPRFEFTNLRRVASEP